MLRANRSDGTCRVAREVKSPGLLSGMLGSLLDHEKKPQEQKSWSTTFQLAPLREKAKGNTSCQSYYSSGGGEKLYLNKLFWRSLHMEMFGDFHCFG